MRYRQLTAVGRKLKPMTVFRPGFRVRFGFGFSIGPSANGFGFQALGCRPRKTKKIKALPIFGWKEEENPVHVPVTLLSNRLKIQQLSS